MAARSSPSRTGFPRCAISTASSCCSVAASCRTARRASLSRRRACIAICWLGSRMLFRRQHREKAGGSAPGPRRRAAACVSAARREFNDVGSALKLNGLWGLRPQRVQGRARAFLIVFLSAAAPPPSTPAKVEQVRKAVAESLLGQPVTDVKGDLFGRVVDVLIDADGTPH